MSDSGESDHNIRQKKRGRPAGAKNKVAKKISRMKGLRSKQLEQAQAGTSHASSSFAQGLASSDWSTSESEYVPSPRKKFVLQDPRPRSSGSDSDSSR